uniref:Uncharacterized protein n=1 Tax=Arundo donax TaxID=35708 RepID=A0A0A8Z3B6_ARUDO
MLPLLEFARRDCGRRRWERRRRRGIICGLFPR